MNGFIKVKYEDCRYTPIGGNNMWLNLDNVVAFEEEINMVYTTSGQSFRISDDTKSNLLEALKGGAE